MSSKGSRKSTGLTSAAQVAAGVLSPRAWGGRRSLSKRHHWPISNARLETNGIGLQVDLFASQAAPHPLDEDIVQPPPAAVHADAHAGGFQVVGKRRAGELRRWSVLKISGRPFLNRINANSSQSGAAAWR